MGRGAFAVACLLSLLVSGPASAFGTLNILGQHEEHARITRQALAPLGLDEATLSALAGGGGRFGAVGAPDRPGRGLIFASEAHCDNADRDPDALTACRAFLFRHIGKAVASAGDLVDAEGRPRADQLPPAADCRFDDSPDRPARCRVLADLGIALHVTQDFYAHSNWTDPPGFTPPGLGGHGPAPFLAEPNADLPPGLVTGCFGGLPEWLFCHGRVRHADVAKDTAAAGERFGPAFDAAVLDSRAKWLFFESELRAAYGERRGGALACLVRRGDAGACEVAPGPAGR